MNDYKPALVFTSTGIVLGGREISRDEMVLWFQLRADASSVAKMDTALTIATLRLEEAGELIQQVA